MQYITIRHVKFQKINEQIFKNINLSNIKFFMILQSGLIDTPGNIYIFTTNGAFFLTKTKDNFIDKFLSIMNKNNWKIINLYFCDFLVINPEIYDSFMKELCAKNIRDFWFETAIDMYKNGLN